MARLLVTEDGVLELNGVSGCDYDGGFGSVGCKESSNVYHWDLVTSTHKGKEENFDSRSF